MRWSGLSGRVVAVAAAMAATQAPAQDVRSSMGDNFRLASRTGLLCHVQQRLMADPATSHPYYWSGFAIIGDGAQDVVSAE